MRKTGSFVTVGLIAFALFVGGFAVSKMQQAPRASSSAALVLGEAAYTPMPLQKGEAVRAELVALEDGEYAGPCAAVCAGGKKAEVLLFSPASEN